MTTNADRRDTEPASAPAVGDLFASADGYRLSCTEVWGGNEATDVVVRASGLDAHAFSLPYDGHTNGGDVLHVTSCSSGRITRALMADVVGHGQGAAEAAQTLRSLMRRSVDILNQSKLVCALNDSFAELQERGRFASAIVASFFRPTGTLTICNAGHPPPLYYCAARQEWSLLEPEGTSNPKRRPPSNLPLGLFGAVEYRLQEMTLKEGDVVLLYTDGVIEAADERDEQYGTERLLELVEDYAPASIDEIVPRVLSSLRRWVGTAPLDDDVTLMILGRNELKSSLRDDVLAPVRFLRSRLVGSADRFL
jgi:serine phosphatase RsbU (regulator of sigma subunit)